MSEGWFAKPTQEKIHGHWVSNELHGQATFHMLLTTFFLWESDRPV